MWDDIFLIEIREVKRKNCFNCFPSNSWGLSWGLGSFLIQFVMYSFSTIEIIAVDILGSF